MLQLFILDWYCSQGILISPIFIVFIAVHTDRRLITFSQWRKVLSETSIYIIGFISRPVYNFLLLRPKLREWGIRVVTNLRRQMFVRQFVTDKVLIPPNGKQKNHLTTYLFSVKLLLFARCFCETFQWAARRKKWRMFWNRQKRKQNVCRSKNCHSFVCTASTCDSG